MEVQNRPSPCSYVTLQVPLYVDLVHRVATSLFKGRSFSMSGMSIQRITYSNFSEQNKMKIEKEKKDILEFFSFPRQFNCLMRITIIHIYFL